jgi:hypothetical protein
VSLDGETHTFPLNDVRNNQTKMNFSTPFSPENKISSHLEMVLLLDDNKLSVELTPINDKFG